VDLVTSTSGFQTRRVDRLDSCVCVCVCVVIGDLRITVEAIVPSEDCSSTSCEKVIGDPNVPGITVEAISVLGGY